MITFVTGKPGDGKTMYGMKLIVDSLLHTNRVIATNIAVKVPELRAYLVLRGWKPKPGEDLAERLIILNHEDVFEFYRHRSGGYVMPPSPDWTFAREKEDDDGIKAKKLSRYKFLKHMTAQMRELKRHKRALRPVEYHIDEAHDYFSAREWTDTGRGILWYASKHRHLHDEIVLYTQVMANVEAQLRGLASFTVRARNQLRMSWGPFRKAPIFRLYHYHGGPEDTDKCTAYNSGVMQLDRDGLCKTYNSAGALSVHDKPEEVKNKAPLPYWALPLAGGVAVLAVVAFMVALPMFAGKMAGKRIEKSSAETANALGVPVPQAAQKTETPSARAELAHEKPTVTRAEFQKPFRARAEEDETASAAVRVVGVMVAGDALLVATEGHEWSRVHMDIGGGLVELANGVIVRKSDVLHPQKKRRAQPDNELARAPRGVSKIAGFSQ